MYKVLITDYLAPPATIEQEALAGFASVACLLARSADELVGRVTDADALIVYHEVTIPARLIETLERCRVIVRAGVGFDGVDLATAGARGIRVCNVPDYGVDEVADHAVALMLACNRGLPHVERYLRSSMSPWNYRAVAPVFRLAGATMGIVGLGRIGTATARRAQAFKMRVLACDPYLRPGMDKAVGVEMVELDELLAASDVVSLHVPLSDETRGMIGPDQLAKMRPHAILVNTARGAVVNVDALAEALAAGRIAGAGIDVLPGEPPQTQEPLIRLWREPQDEPVNLVITPHSAFYSEASMEEMRIKAAREIRRVLEGGSPRSCVNEEYLESQ